MTVQEGLRKTITEFELKARDDDTEVIRQDSPEPPSPSPVLLPVWALRKTGLCFKRETAVSVIPPCARTLSVTTSNRQLVGGPVYIETEERVFEPSTALA